VKYIAFILLLSLSVQSVLAQNARSRFFKGKTKIKDITNLRDPFSSALSSRGQTRSDLKKERKIRTNFTNITSPEVYGLADLKVVGVVLGKEKRAIAKVGTDIMTLKEGDVFGKNGVELKAILPGGVVFIEKILNIYGEEEYLETVIPITQE
jgi:Tfp pilus assembly protein PilP